MAELPINNLQRMKSSSWVGSPWFYVCLILALAIVIGLCIKKHKLLGNWVVAVVVVGHVATGEVVTELKGILPEVHFTVVLILINFNLLSTNDEKSFILYIVLRISLH